jgi:hypothetical protein
MVGNAEPDLVAALPRLPATYRARGEGCEGILEGLLHFGFAALLGDLAADVTAPSLTATGRSAPPGGCG